MPEEQVTTKEAPVSPNIDALATKLAAALAPSFATLGESIAKAVANPQTVRVTAQPITDAEIEVRRAVVPSGGGKFHETDLADFKLSNLVKGATRGDLRRYASLELDMCSYAAQHEAFKGVVPDGRHVITKDMATNPDPKGGFIIPSQIFDAQLEPLLKAEVSIWRLGVRKYTNLKGSPVLLNRITGDPTAYDYVGDTASPSAITTSDMTLDQVSMRPHTVAAATRLSNDLIEMSSDVAEDIVREAIAEQIGLKMDYNGYQGAGNNAAPQGIFDSDNIWTVTGFGALSASTAYDKLSEMISKLRLANALKGKLGWAIPAAAEHALRIMKDPTDNSQPKHRRILSENGVDATILGFPYVSSTQIPDNKIMFGDWSKFAYGQWGTLFLAIDSLTPFKLLQTQILAAMKYDFVCRQEKSFCQSVSLTGAP